MRDGRQPTPRISRKAALAYLGRTISSMLGRTPTEQMRSANAVVFDLDFGRHDRRIWVVSRSNSLVGLFETSSIYDGLCAIKCFF